MTRLAIVTGIASLACIVLGRTLVPTDAVPALAVAADAEPAAPAAAPDAAASAYAGDEACAVCHEEIATAVGRSVHGTAQREAWKGRSCEGCHGPGQAHVDAGGGKGNIRAFDESVPATKRVGACLGCHGGDPHLRDARASEHVLAGVACNGCHVGHGPGVGDAMLRKAETDLCMSCHLDVRAAFAMPYRHGITQGRVECDDCHEPHGTRNPAMLKAANDRTCLSCHTEQQGPWVFEHATVVTEGCGSCHVPHGSANRHLLQYQQVAQLCYRCHTLTPQNHVQPQFRDCTRCHVWVHGSNTDPRFLEP